MAAANTVLWRTLVRSIFPGSVRLQRAGRGILLGRAFVHIFTSRRSNFIFGRPNPSVVLILSRHLRIPRIPQDRSELLGEIAIRSNEAIERFLLPDSPLVPSEPVNLPCRESFKRSHQLRERPENGIAFVCVLLRPRLKQRVHVIRHDAEREEFVARPMEMPPGV